jgi:SPP1 family predicted phage head-tail adaptor
VTLDQLITISRKAQTQQADGSLQTTLTKLADAYAAAYPMKGDERRASMQTEERADYRFHIHYRADLRADDVITWNGQQFNIRFIADKGPGSVYLMIEAEKGVAI